MTRRSSHRRDTGLRPPRWWERDRNRYCAGAIVLSLAVIVAVWALKAE